MSTQRPCGSCPWRRSTPKRGFPGGYVNAARLLEITQERACAVMQCHATPDTAPRVCIGFARRFPNNPALRVVTLRGLFDPTTVDPHTPAEHELHTLWSLLRKHGGVVKEVK